MELKHYFDSHQGLGILSTADNQGPLAATDHEQACGQADHNRECRLSAACNTPPSVVWTRGQGGPPPLS